MQPIPMTDDERYFFDVTGYLVVEDALTGAEVAACNAAIDQFSERIKPRGREKPLAEGSAALQGQSGRLELTGMLAWEKPWCEPFRKLLVHPQIVGRLNEMSGQGFRLDHGPLLIGAEAGTEGHLLHGAGEPWAHVVAYHHQNGRMYCAGVTVAWQLADVNPGDGGFAIVPGSHKANYPTPRECATHGNLPWKGKGPRRSVLYKYAARHVSRAAGPDGVPEHRWGEWVGDMTDEQRAVMYGPYVHGPIPAIGEEQKGR
jgi:hypothetical protein